MPQYTYDFTDAPPEQGGVGFERVPPGKYAFRLSKYDDKASGTGKPMVRIAVTIASGPLGSDDTTSHKGKVLGTNFVLGGTKTNFGVRRLHAFFIAMGVKTSAGPVKIDSDKLINRPGLMVVRDRTMEATDEYPERTVSDIVEFHPLTKKAAPAAKAEEEEDEEEEEESPPPKKTTAKKAAPPPPEEETEDLAELEDEVDTMFD